MYLYTQLKPFYSSSCLDSVHVFLNESIFEAFSPTMHITELARLLKKLFPNTTAVVLYTDEGPDNNCKHISVRFGLLLLFLKLDLDTMVVMRTAPTKSWSNPVERMSDNMGAEPWPTSSCASKEEDDRRDL